MTDDERKQADEKARRAGECCAAWAMAHHHGTDGEGYSSLIYTDREGREIAGVMFDFPLRFCPWCGKAVDP